MTIPQDIKMELQRLCNNYNSAKSNFINTTPLSRESNKERYGALINLRKKELVDRGKIIASSYGEKSLEECLSEFINNPLDIKDIMRDIAVTN